MRFTMFDNLFATSGDEMEMSFPEFVEFMKPVPAARKDGVPLFSPAIYEGPRSKNNVRAITALVFDLDSLQPADYWLISQVLESHECDYLLYSTHSHHPNAPKLRVVIPLSRPLRIEGPNDWSKNYWFSAVESFEMEAYVDGSAKDPSRFYYVPCFHPDRADPGEEDLSDDVEYIVYEHRLEGKLFDPEALPPVWIGGPEAEIKDVAGTDLAAEVAEYANELKRSKSARIKEVGKRLLIMLEGGAYAEPGGKDILLKGRDNATFYMAAYLAERFPRTAPERLATLFVPSLRVMEDLTPGAPSYDVVLEKIQRKQEEVREQAEVQQQREDAARANLISRAFCSDRTHPYTDEELESFGDMSHKYIILHGKQYYVYFNGNYNEPVSTQDEMQLVAERDLAPFDSVNMWTIAPGGLPMQKSPKELVRQYGDTAAEVLYDLTIRRSKFENKTLHLAKPGWDNDLRPKFNEQVHRWLELLGGEPLIAWLSKFPDLTIPLAALYLANYPGAGKSLLAKGLVRLWGRNAMPIAAEQAFGQFRSSMLLCPLIFADESLPRVPTSDLREMIQSGDRIVDIKFRSPIKQAGHIRMMMAANNENLISTRESLSSEDLQAINERFLFVDVQSPPAEYLKQLVAEGVDIDKWRTNGTIAEHVLWLAENKQYARHGRYLYGDIKAENQLGSRLAMASTVTASILDWALRLLRTPEAVEAGGRELHWDERGLQVTPDLIVETWGMLMRNVRCPSPLTVAQAIEAVSHPNPDRMGKILDAGVLAMYNERVMLFEPDLLTKRFKQGNNDE